MEKQYDILFKEIGPGMFKLVENNSDLEVPNDDYLELLEVEGYIKKEEYKVIIVDYEDNTIQSNFGASPYLVKPKSIVEQQKEAKSQVNTLLPTDNAIEEVNHKEMTKLLVQISKPTDRITIPQYKEFVRDFIKLIKYTVQSKDEAYMYKNYKGFASIISVLDIFENEERENINFWISKFPNLTEGQIKENINSGIFSDEYKEFILSK